MTQSPLSDNLPSQPVNEVYALFALPVGRYSMPDFPTHKKQIFKWIETQDIRPEHERLAITHNVSQIGKRNTILEDNATLADFLLDKCREYNTESYNYDLDFAISDCYLELATKGALYAPHEHSNCIYSATLLINYIDGHSPLKFRRAVNGSYYPVMQFPNKDYTAFNMTEATVPMNEGDLIIYPSSMTHGYEGNPYDDRVTLTVNFIPNK
ncbi:putative 2OG-Fe(II) oxygenase [Nonlabens xiamenensis]|uniref:putative 2OG-Fe(II) oxygenase n=1 Tax=Nonlabens xiamenensis TaxID=2341043 RepID=UPI000F614D06|nr:putative 2OG-Fe(II) oxygenase [Nonlabens xiamenensis]|tara:strand:- start:29751 stop:30383 length:633 start_codon:yes stop_codon:yes gene_type:complete